jgi:hypothetical protein
MRMPKGMKPPARQTFEEMNTPPGLSKWKMVLRVRLRSATR